MPRLIDADRLTRPEMLGKYYHLQNGDTAIPIVDIENAPTVDAAPVKHGYWIPSRSQHGMFVCSVCNDEWGTAAKMVPMLFCPTCGAKMDGGRG